MATLEGDRKRREFMGNRTEAVKEVRKRSRECGSGQESAEAVTGFESTRNWVKTRRNKMKRGLA
jgi:hypothetical protein